MEHKIKIQETSKGSVVSARELYDFLELNPSQWSRWYQSNIINEDLFIENIDYQTIDIMSNGNPTKDFAISIDMAKEISMLARTEKGKIARKYFIDCEKKLKQGLYELPQTFSEALRLLADTKEREEKALLELKSANDKIIEDKPKVLFAESVTGSSNSILVRQFAKDLCDSGFDIGQNRLFEWLRKKGYLNSDNEPYQNYVSQGLFEVITRTIGSGLDTFTSKTTKITGKGAVYFASKIKDNKDLLNN